MPDWSIKIRPNPGGPADAPGRFDPLDATLDDIVSWNNTTDDKHHPWPTDSNYVPLGVTPDSTEYLADEIPPGQSSDSYDLPTPTTVDPATGLPTIFYYCKCHPAEHGKITVKPIPAAPPAPPPQD